MKIKLLIAVTLLLTSIVIPAFSADVSNIQWDFEAYSKEGAWTGNVDITGLKTIGGLLVGEATDKSPMLTSPQFTFKPGFYDVVTIQLRSEKSGEAQLFWANNADEPDGGFRPWNSIRFYIKSGQSMPFEIYPFWHKDESIVQIRIALPPGKFRISFVRVRHKREPVIPSSGIYAWQFPNAINDWSVMQTDTTLKPDNNGASLRSNPCVLVGSPSLRVSSEINKYITLKMQVSAGKKGALGWVTSEKSGMKFLPFDIQADGQMHTYTINVSQSADWADQIRLIAISPSDAPEANVVIGSIFISPKPQATPVPSDLHKEGK